MRLSAKLASMVVGLILIAAHSAYSQTASKVVRFVSPYDAATFDPITSTLSVVQQHGYLMYDTLFSRDAAGKPQPQMVESDTLDPTGRIYTMVLRPGLKFHDGSPVRAQDAIASIARWAKRDPVGGILLRRFGMQTALVDDRTFTVSTNVPTPLLLEGFSKPLSSALFVMREKDALSDPAKPVTDNIGSGPFRFVKSEFVPGSKVVYERNPDYIPRSEPASYLAGGKKVNIDRVEFLNISDPATASAALANGEVDVWEAPPFDLYPAIKAQKGIEHKLLNTGGIMAVFRPNHLQPPFDNAKIRQAVMALVDQKEIMSVAAGDPENWRECYSFLGCGSPAMSEKGMDRFRKPDLQLAKSLLREGGYKGEPISLMQPSDRAPYTQLTEILAAHMREAGMNVTLVPNDWATIAQRRSNRKSLAEGGWSGFISQTFDFEINGLGTSLWMGSPCDQSGFFGWPCDEKIEALRTQWALETDPAKRREIEIEAQQRASDTVPFISLGQFFWPVVYNAKIKDMLDTPVTVFWNMKIE